MNEDRFLSRWMRRKAAARKADAAPAEPRPVPPAEPSVQGPVVADAPPAQESERRAPSTPASPASQPAELPTLDSLQGLASDYEAFMRAEVDPQTRQAALRKLFSDPHFNQMDGLDIYIDDYGKPDPIPPAMLAGLEQARSLLRADTQADAESEAADVAEPLALSEESPSEPPPHDLSPENEELGAVEGDERERPEEGPKDV